VKGVGRVFEMPGIQLRFDGVQARLAWAFLKTYTEPTHQSRSSFIVYVCAVSKDRSAQVFLLLSGANVRQ
jgi:hypothetical protein